MDEFVLEEPLQEISLPEPVPHVEVAPPLKKRRRNPEAFMVTPIELAEASCKSHP